MNSDEMQTEQMTRAGPPSALPWRAWRHALVRTWQQVEADHLSIIAAGCAFFALLAMFPAISAGVSAYGLVSDPAEVADQLSGLAGVLPDNAFSLILEQTERLASQSDAKLSLSFVFTLVLALWSATKAARAILGALNIVYGEKEKRGIIKLNAQILGLTAAGILGCLLALTVVALIPAWMAFVGLGGIEILVSVVRWPILGVAIAFALSALYRMGPSRSPALWQWVSPGAVAATLLWLLGSIGFSVYVQNFGNYDQTYGAFGALIILLLWFYFSFFIILLGAELNAELEHEVVPDTTADGPDPLGRRGAVMADRVAALEQGEG